VRASWLRGGTGPRSASSRAAVAAGAGAPAVA